MNSRYDLKMSSRTQAGAQLLRVLVQRSQSAHGQCLLLPQHSTATRTFSLGAVLRQAGWSGTQRVQTASFSAQGRNSSTTTTKLPPFIGQPVSFEGTVDKVLNENKETGFKVLSVKLDANAWRTISPFVNSPDLPKTEAPRSQPAYIHKHIQRKRINERKLTVYGTLSWVGEGAVCAFKGRWDFHQQFGLRVAVDYARELRTGDLEAIKKKLQGILPGCGPKTAADIVEKFKERTEDVLNSQNAVTELLKINKIGAYKAKVFKQAWDERRENQGAAMFLQDLGLRRSTADAAVRRFGPENVEAVFRADPHYALMQLPGFNLKLADSIADKLEVQPVPRSRGAAGMLQALLYSATSNGHTFLTWAQLQRETTRLLDEHALAVAALQELEPGAQDQVAQQGEGTALQAQQPAAPSAPLDMRDLANCLMELRKLVLEEGGVLHSTAQGAPAVRVQRHPVQPGIAAASGADADSSDALGMWPWVPSTRAYLPQLYEAETDVAELLGTLQANASGISSSDAGGRGAGSAGVAPAASAPGAASDAALDARRASHAAASSSRSPSPAQGPPQSSQQEAAPVKVDPAVYRLLQDIEAEGVELTLKQASAIQMAHSARVMLLTGAAGCGKTFVTRAIVQLWRQQGLRVRMCAPTGRAAQRLQEAVNDPTLEAMTVHRMLGYKRKEDEPRAADKDKAESSGEAERDKSKGADGKEGQEVDVVDESGGGEISLLDTLAFEHNRLLPLEADAVLVDEASMLDVQLAAVLLRALPSGCRLLLVGDPNQLPPVGPGGVLQDMITMGAFPRVHLDEIFRQSSCSSIVTGAHAIIAGTSPAERLTCMTLDGFRDRLDTAMDIASAGISSSAMDGQASDGQEPEQPISVEAEAAGERPVWKPHKGCPPAVAALQPGLLSDAILVQLGEEACDTDVGEQAASVVKLLKDAKVDVARDLQVLSPTRQHAVGVIQLNRLLQPIMNPRGVGAGAGEGGSSRPSWRQQLHVGDRVVQVENNYDHDVFNGDLGTVVRVDERSNATTVEFAKRPGGEGPHQVVYKDSARNQLQLAWATTVHKAQGGEFPVVVAPLHEKIAASLLQRKMLYTTVTRARHLLILVATRTALDRASSHKSLRPRNSLLSARLTRSWANRGLPLPPQPAAGTAASPAPPASPKGKAPYGFGQPAKVTQTQTQQAGGAAGAAQPVRPTGPTRRKSIRRQAMKGSAWPSGVTTARGAKETGPTDPATAPQHTSHTDVGQQPPQQQQQQPQGQARASPDAESQLVPSAPTPAHGVGYAPKRSHSTLASQPASRGPSPRPGVNPIWEHLLVATPPASPEPQAAAGGSTTRGSSSSSQVETPDSRSAQAPGQQQGRSHVQTTGQRCRSRVVSVPATEPQLQYLRDLGYTGDQEAHLTKTAASKLIQQLKAEQARKDGK